MRLMRLLLVPLVGLLLLGAATAPSVRAADLITGNDQVCNNPNKADVPIICSDANKGKGGQNPLVGPQGVISRYISILSLVVGIMGVVALMVAGLRFITANGNSQTIATAQRTAYYAFGALVIASMAQAIVSFVLTKI